MRKNLQRMREGDNGGDDCNNKVQSSSSFPYYVIVNYESLVSKGHFDKKDVHGCLYMWLDFSAEFKFEAKCKLKHINTTAEFFQRMLTMKKPWKTLRGNGNKLLRRGLAREILSRSWSRKRENWKKVQHRTEKMYFLKMAQQSINNFLLCNWQLFWHAAIWFKPIGPVTLQLRALKTFQDEIRFLRRRTNQALHQRAVLVAESCEGRLKIRAYLPCGYHAVKSVPKYTIAPCFRLTGIFNTWVIYFAGSLPSSRCTVKHLLITVKHTIGFLMLCETKMNSDEVVMSTDVKIIFLAFCGWLC